MKNDYHFLYSKFNKKCNVLIKLLIFIITFNFSYSSKYRNEYITTKIKYKDNNTTVVAELIYFHPENFYIYNYDIDKIKKYSNIELITNLTFVATIYNKNIFNFKIFNPNEDRFNISMADFDYYNYLVNNKNYSNITLKDIGFHISNIGEPFTFFLKDKISKKIYYAFDRRNFLFTDTLIFFDLLLTSKYIYGFGERNYDFNLDIGKYTIWPNDTTFTYRDKKIGGYNLMGHQPLGLHRTKYGKYIGLLFLNYNAQDVIINKTNKINKNYIQKKFDYYLRHITIGGIINYYLTFGNTPDEAIKQIHRIIGIPMIPPFWGLGWHQSRWGYKTTRDLLYVLDNYTKYHIPFDGIWTDIDLMQDKNSFFVSKNHKNTYKLIALLHLKNKHFIPLLDLAIPYDLSDFYFLEGVKTKGFIISNYTKTSLISHVWAGLSVFPDLLTDQGQNLWILGLLNFNNEINFDGVWLDMNEPAMTHCCYFDTGEVIYNETLANSDEFNKYKNIPYIPGSRKDHESINSKSISVNAYSRLNKKMKKKYYTMYNVKTILSRFQAELTYRYIYYYKNKRPFIVSRGNTVSHGKFGFHWLGDNRSGFNYLKWSISNIFNYNIFGIPFVGADICGFHNDTTDELCARWHVLGAFYPFSRNHNVDTALDQEPWSFIDSKRFHEKYLNDKKRPKYGGYTLKVARKSIRLRYSLLRYFYTQLFLISLNLQSSFFKPAFFEFPFDKILLNNKKIQNTHIMIGDSLYFVPDLNLDRDNYTGYFPNENFNMFPEGYNFVDYKENRTKGFFKSLKGDYFTINVFIKGGSIIPFQNVSDVLSSYDLRFKTTDIIINPNKKLFASGSLIFDYDDKDVISKGKYFFLKIFFKENKLNFLTLNDCQKSKNYNEHILNNIIIYRGNELCCKKLQIARIYFVDNKNISKPIKYVDNIIYINNIFIPFYLISFIILK